MPLFLAASRALGAQDAGGDLRIPLSRARRPHAPAPERLSGAHPGRGDPARGTGAPINKVEQMIM